MNEGYAKTYVDWDGTIKVKYYPLYDNLPTDGLKYSVQLHEYVHVMQLQPYTENVCDCLWGEFAERRAVSDIGYYHMEVQATQMQLDYLDHYIYNLPAADEAYRLYIVDFISAQSHNLREFKRGLEYD